MYTVALISFSEDKRREGKGKEEGKKESHLFFTYSK